VKVPTRNAARFSVRKHAKPQGELQNMVIQKIHGETLLQETISEQIDSGQIYTRHTANNEKVMFTEAELPLLHYT